MYSGGHLFDRIPLLLEGQTPGKTKKKKKNKRMTQFIPLSFNLVSSLVSFLSLSLSSYLRRSQNNRFSVALNLFLTLSGHMG